MTVYASPEGNLKVIRTKRERCGRPPVSISRRRPVRPVFVLCLNPKPQVEGSHNRPQLGSGSDKSIALHRRFPVFLGTPTGRLRLSKPGKGQNTTWKQSGFLMVILFTTSL